MSDQLVAEAENDTTHKKHNRQRSKLSAGFEPSILAIKRLQNHILDRTEANILLACLRRQMCHKIWDRDGTNGFSSRQIFFSFRLLVKKFLALTQNETVKCPTYSPDFATGEKFLFPRLKSFVQGTHFECAVHEMQ